MQRKIPRRIVDGVLLLDKPSGMTSNGALQTARRLLNAAKAGHTGTLDPMASGLLPLTFGEATKFSQILLDADKTYEAGVKLGTTTDTGDADGNVVAEHPVSVTREALEEVLSRFRGEIDQLPPMYSALKRDGKPLYEYARAGIEIEREVRRVTIHDLELIAFSGEHFSMRVRCSKGTYIRTLAMDIGAALGCGAYLDALRRTAIGDFDAARAVTLEALEASPAAMRDGLLEPVDALVAHFPKVELQPAEAAAILQGRELRKPEDGQGSVRLFCGGRFLGVGEWQSGSLRPKRLIATQTGQ
ncbi:tRNA pseudouridine(55) synthase TruB [Azoarcus olearius]|uniref:tRNA pseudouridine synthase B n=1 Tax=Azoarcus sp. (strain BH72) TaxID=418699 RepID=TRUB_AZOSB|nr:tRNA pseudouridine(55) synthase TruB [Azoarcus olearius]A1K7B7.1 RecName: Full=tRNA pseudouridine synthase B; AltName: Full=tRNA pseudouridine(55) synthase; Short=Psi55 synthase; AltName: Full=tRNA pseudouridylate synthase; AltName: Full=tRNA-uridine isomerase [Azoarcus olearius]CAL94722.1 tRNA pseudouridine 55 synthase [Azoarcus olearius]